MQNKEPQWDKIEYSLVDVLGWAIADLKALCMEKMCQAETDAEQNWWLTHFIGYDRVPLLVDQTDAEELQETIRLVSNKIGELKTELETSTS